MAEGPIIAGKMPGHGDFVFRGVSTELEQALDAWLSDLMDAYRAATADDFENVYRGAQPWLFSGTQVQAVLIPSQDKVGRLYPLLAVSAAGPSLQPLYDVVVDALSHGWKCDRLHDALGGLDPSDAPAEARGWFLPDDSVDAMPDPTTLGHHDILEDLFR